MVGNVTADARPAQISDVMRIDADRFPGNRRGNLDAAHGFRIGPDDAAAALRRRLRLTSANRLDIAALEVLGELLKRLVDVFRFLMDDIGQNLAPSASAPHIYQFFVNSSTRFFGR